MEETDLNERKAFIRSLGKRIEIDKEQFILQYKVPLPMEHVFREGKMDKAIGMRFEMAIEEQLLSEHELEVLRLMATWASNKDIASRLSLSHGIVMGIFCSIYHKFDVRNRQQAVVEARKMGLI